MASPVGGSNFLHMEMLKSEVRANEGTKYTTIAKIGDSYLTIGFFTCKGMNALEVEKKMEAVFKKVIDINKSLQLGKLNTHNKTYTQVKIYGSNEDGPVEVTSKQGQKAEKTKSYKTQQDFNHFLKSLLGIAHKAHKIAREALAGLQRTLSISGVDPTDSDVDSPEDAAPASQQASTQQQPTRKATPPDSPEADATQPQASALKSDTATLRRTKSAPDLSELDNESSTNPTLNESASDLSELHNESSTDPTATVTQSAAQRLRAAASLVGKAFAGIASAASAFVKSSSEEPTAEVSPPLAPPLPPSSLASRISRGQQAHADTTQKTAAQAAAVERIHQGAAGLKPRPAAKSASSISEEPEWQRKARELQERRDRASSADSATRASNTAGTAPTSSGSSGASAAENVPDPSTLTFEQRRAIFNKDSQPKK